MFSQNICHLTLWINYEKYMVSLGKRHGIDSSSNILERNNDVNTLISGKEKLRGKEEKTEVLLSDKVFTRHTQVLDSIPSSRNNHYHKQSKQQKTDTTEGV